MTDGKRPAGRPPERTNVVVYFKRALATAPEQESAVWPKNWPLPAHGDMVKLGSQSGFVDHLTFDPGANTIYIHTR